MMLFSPNVPTPQASSGSLDHLKALSCTDERAERRSSVEGRHQRIERKGSGNAEKCLDKAKRSSLERYVGVGVIN